jgi:hypothetical protein
MESRAEGSNCCPRWVVAGTFGTPQDIDLQRESLTWHRTNMLKRDKQKKHPKDVTQLARFLGDLSTQQLSAEPGPILSSSLSEYMSAIGRKGGQIGGKRRMKTMTSEERRKVAVKAAKARWKKSR